MKKNCLFILVFLFATGMYAQKQTFDIITYTPPKGWKKQTTESAVQFTKQDAANGAYCIITLMKSLASGGNSKENFDAAWETVVKEMVKVSTAPEMQPVVTEDGWEAQSGYAPFEADSAKGVVILVTSSGYEKMVNILVMTNTDVYEKEMTAFLESVSFKKPTVKLNQTKGNETKTTNNKEIIPAAEKDGFTFSTTNFDDGWKSEIQNDWVLVSKGDIKVYLWYALPYNATDFSGTGLVARDYYWDNYVTKYFNVQTKQYNDNGEFIGSFKPDYVEGWATDKQTGEKRFIGMRLSIAPNTAYLTIASTKDEASLRQQFPNANDKYTSDLGKMDYYNRFAVSENDITGTWQDGNTSTMQWYYAHPGGYESYAGMTVAASSATFNFNTDGNYTSIHNGATGAVGAMSTFQQNYKGKYTVSNWIVTATNRWDGKTDKFEAWFVAVRGGRILRLKDRGMEYSLLKTR
jgi:hypothetical protein